MKCPNCNGWVGDNQVACVECDVLYADTEQLNTVVQNAMQLYLDGELDALRATNDNTDVLCTTLALIKAGVEEREEEARATREYDPEEAGL